MFLKISASLIFLCVLTAAAANAQPTTGGKKLPIINGAATSLPHPDYPEEAKEFCAGGTVSVKIETDENGNVISAEAVAGDELLRAASVEAAKKAKFKISGDSRMPVGMKGLIVYSFSPENKCVDGGIVNKKALSIPTPKLNPDFMIEREISVVVNVLIDESGKVIRALTSKDVHPVLRGAFEAAARQATFPPTFIDGSPIRVKGVIVYKIKPNAPRGN